MVFRARISRLCRSARETVFRGAGHAPDPHRKESQWPSLPRKSSPSISRTRCAAVTSRSEEHTSELQSLMRISYAVFCLKKKQLKTKTQTDTEYTTHPNPTSQ